VVRPGRPAWGRRTAASLLRVQPDVMVIVAGCDEHCLVAQALLHVEAEHITVERKRPVDAGDL
jgi:hypothetical protein